MAASQSPDPDESSGLSAQEKRILAAIEYDLLVADPTLARHLECADWPRAGTRWRAAARHGALLIAALIVLILAAAALPSSGWQVLGLLTALLLVPWILFFPTSHPHQH